MQTDTIDQVARDLLPDLRQVAPPAGLAARALALLADWDGAMAVNLPQPLIFNAWMQRLYQDILTRAKVPPDAMAAVAPWTTLIPSALTQAGDVLCGGDCRALLPSALAAASAELAERFGPDPAVWRWGAAHRAVFANPLLRAIPCSARPARSGSPSPATIRRCGVPAWRWVRSRRYIGASFRGVYDLADLERSLFVVAPGQSGHVLSPLARNFVQLWADGAMIMIPARPERTAVWLTLVPGETK